MLNEESLSCSFCKIINGQLPCSKIYEDDNYFAFHDINPQTELHFLIIPKLHHSMLSEMNFEDAELLGRMMLLAPKLVGELGYQSDRLGGFRLMSNGPDGGQEVYHVHLHVMAGKKKSKSSKQSKGNIQSSVDTQNHATIKDDTK